MRKLLLLLVLTMALAACSGPSEISIPDANIKYENGTLLYKGKPYSGKITSNLADKVNGYTGFISLKEGHLEGLTEVTSNGGEKIKLAVVNGQFDGDYVVEKPNVARIFINFKQGKMKTIKVDAPGMKQDLTVLDDGNLDGSLTMGGQTITLVKGAAEMNGTTIKVYVKEGGNMITETYKGSKLLKQQESNIAMKPKALEEMVFSSLR